MGNSVKFYVSYHPAEWGFEEETAGTLYSALSEELVYWFDNFNSEWNRSLLSHSSIREDKEFKLVDYFDNGYVTTDDALDYFLRRGLIAPDQVPEDREM